MARILRTGAWNHGQKAIGLEGVRVAFSRNQIHNRSLKHALARLFGGASVEADAHVALDHVDLDIQRGEHVGVIGRNGAGKSTLLRVMARVIVPQRGQVFVAPQCRVVPLLELGIGFQGDLSGVENCHLAGSLMGFASAEIAERMDSIVAFSELGDAIREPVKTYSSGMYARLAFALATDVEPDILLVDEVFGVGDEFFMRRCVERIRGLMAGGTTTVFVSHDLEFLLRHCDRLVWLDAGRVVRSGDPALVAADYRTHDGRVQGGAREADHRH